MISLFGPITKADKHLAIKWLLWHEQSLPPSCFSSLLWQQHFPPPHQDWPQGSLNLTTGITDSHLRAAADGLASEAEKH